MKSRLKLGLSLIIFSVILGTSCKKENDNGNPPQLPPAESMSTDFSNFSSEKMATENSLKSAEVPATLVNYNYAVTNVAFWNIALTVTLVVPITAFANSFNHDPVFIGDATWEWTYDYNVLGGTYSARLTGTVNSSTVDWHMYISKVGIGGFSELEWFSGTSQLDGKGGTWVLNYSVAHPDPFLKIEWTKTDDIVGEITYTIVREKTDDNESNPNKGSYINAGYQGGDYDGYYNIHVYDSQVAQDFVDVNIEWSTSEFYGHVKASHFYGDENWHCWDSYGLDTDCAN